MTQQYMLLFSLGPVQSFIAQARKTRDLWLGSFLLSALMQASMQGIESNLIFPSKPYIEKNIPDLPNKYIAIFNTKDEAELAAKNSEAQIITFWNGICNDVWNKVLAKPVQVSTQASPETRKQWDAQTNPANVFEFYWVVVAEDGKKYKDWLTETQYMFDRRKHLRDFNQQIEAGEKSTISGQRSALHGDGKERYQVKKFWENVASDSRLSHRDISHDGAERLDAIDTVKRFAHLSVTLAQLVYGKDSDSFKAGFPSVSSIATASFVEQLMPVSESKTVAPKLSEWFDVSKALDDPMPPTIPLLTSEAKQHRHGPQILERDGDCFFPETYSENRLLKEFGFKDRREAQKLSQEGPEAIAKLLRATDALIPSITRPIPYYAMIQMDGDKMGTLINGVSGKDEHQKISRALSDFSRIDVPRLVEGSYPGRLIYAGGDDVFAIVPLARDTMQHNLVPESDGNKTLLQLVNQLQTRYRAIVSAVVENEPVTDTTTTKKKKTRKELVTASAGIAIAHHYTSLSYVRRMSKEAEQLAKNHYGRNALVVTVLRRSGEQTRVGCHWDYPGLNADAQPIKLFSFFYDLFADDVLSPKCVHTLLDEAPTLVALSEDAQVSEIKRVLMRQRNPSLKERFPDETLKVKAQQLVDLAKAMDNESLPSRKDGISVELHAEKRRHGLVEVLGWLLVMLFLARKEQE